MSEPAITIRRLDPADPADPADSAALDDCAIDEAEPLNPGAFEGLDRGIATSVGFLAQDWPDVPWYKRLWRRIFPPRIEVESMSGGSVLCLRPGRKPHAGNPVAAGGQSGKNPLGPREGADV